MAFAIVFFGFSLTIVSVDKAVQTPDIAYSLNVTPYLVELRSATHSGDACDSLPPTGSNDQPVPGPTILHRRDRSAGGVPVPNRGRECDNGVTPPRPSTNPCH